MKNRIFEMYNIELTKSQCSNCKNIKLKDGRKKLGPISFWHLGNKFSDKKNPTIAFVGKTKWMD